VAVASCETSGVVRLREHLRNRITQPILATQPIDTTDKRLICSDFTCILPNHMLPYRTMSKICYICGKKPVAGRQIKRRGLAKKKGGVGQRITGISRRRFLPNLQTVRAILNGRTKRIRVCTKCLKAGKVRKATRSPRGEAAGILKPTRLAAEPLATP